MDNGLHEVGADESGFIERDAKEEAGISERKCQILVYVWLEEAGVCGEERVTNGLHHVILGDGEKLETLMSTTLKDAVCVRVSIETAEDH